MSRGFDPPRGDPDALRTAAATLLAVATDLAAQETLLKNACRTALADWQAPRADRFRQASAGLQVLTVAAANAIGDAATALNRHAVVLDAARTRIADLARQAGEAQAAADAQVGRLPAGSLEAHDVLLQATRQRAALEQLAQDVHDALSQAARRAAATMDDLTDAGMPDASKLRPAEIARRVDAAMGVQGLSGARDGRLTEQQAWAVLGSVVSAVPADSVTAEGDPVWKKINDAASFPMNAWTVGTAPPAGWAFYQLARNVGATFLKYLETSAELDRLIAVIGDSKVLVDLRRRSDIIIDAGWSADITVQGFYGGPVQQRPAVMARAAGAGMPSSGTIGRLGRTFAWAGIVGDIVTVMDPDGHSTMEKNINRGAAVANAGATVAVLATAGSTGWVPIAGQVVLLGTGLYLTGNWAYNSYRDDGWAKSVVESAVDGGRSVGRSFTETLMDPFVDASRIINR